jgi:hypothetical protein
VISDVQEACDRILILSRGRLMLDDRIESVRATHRCVPEAALDGDTPIASFLGPDGDRLALVSARAPKGQEPTLEEVVLGYLAAATQSPRAVEA